MTFNEMTKAAHDLIHIFGSWTFDNGDKALKVCYNRNTSDYGFQMVKNGEVIKSIQHSDLDRVTRCLITYIKEERIKDYD